MIINLNSVGCYIDSNTHIVYPLMNTGEADLPNGIHVMECDDGWMEGLSKEDFKTILSFVYSEEEI